LDSAGAGSICAGPSSALSALGNCVFSSAAFVAMVSARASLLPATSETPVPGVPWVIAAE
jgi:hypothetical protein